MLLYLLFMAPALLLVMWAQSRVHSAYQRGMQYSGRMTGAETARRMLDEAGLSQIPIEETPGELADHYDPQHRVVRLSSGVFRTNSLAAMGIAAHEVGHAIQHATNYGLLEIRNLAVPAAVAGPWVSMICFIAGGALLAAHSAALGSGLILVGLLAFAAILAFKVVNLPVEFDASRRAKLWLSQSGAVTQDEAVIVKDVLSAAALTYVAATLQVLSQLLYYVVHFSGALRQSDE